MKVFIYISAILAAAQVISACGKCGKGGYYDDCYDDCYDYGCYQPSYHHCHKSCYPYGNYGNYGYGSYGKGCDYEYGYGDCCGSPRCLKKYVIEEEVPCPTQVCQKSKSCKKGGSKKGGKGEYKGKGKDCKNDCNYYPTCKKTYERVIVDDECCSKPKCHSPCHHHGYSCGHCDPCYNNYYY